MYIPMHFSVYTANYYNDIVMFIKVHEKVVIILYIPLLREQRTSNWGHERQPACM